MLFGSFQFNLGASLFRLSSGIVSHSMKVVVRGCDLGAATCALRGIV